MKISISELIFKHTDGVCYSLYAGNLDPWEIMMDDDEIKEKDLDLFDHESYRKDLAEQYSLHVRPVLEKYLAPYGYKVGEITMYSPRYYNYGNDSFDVELDDSEVSMDDLLPKLIGEIEKYWLDIRKPSCDGYFSHEPDRLEDFKPLDYGTLWAIFEHENAWDELREAHDLLEERISEIAYNNL